MTGWENPYPLSNLPSTSLFLQGFLGIKMSPFIFYSINLRPLFHTTRIAPVSSPYVWFIFIAWPPFSPTSSPKCIKTTHFCSSHSTKIYSLASPTLMRSLNVKLQHIMENCLSTIFQAIFKHLPSAARWLPACQQMHQYRRVESSQMKVRN